MRTKLFMFMMAIGMLLITPTISFAQGYTDEDIDFESSDSSNSDFGPTSLRPVTFTLEPVIVTGVLSHINKTITLDFMDGLGIVTISIIDENGTVVLTQRIDTNREPHKVISIKALPIKNYRIICYNPIDNQRADIELRQ